MTTALRQDVRALDVGPEHRLGEVALAGVDSGAVVAGSVVALDDSLSEQHQRDVLECMLLAQLAANAKADRHRDPTNWYRSYQQVLESVGWVVEASATLSRYLPTGRFSMSTVITDLFRRKVGADELALVTATLSAFTRDPGGPGQFVFECPSHAGGIGNFQFGLASEDDGTVSLLVGRFAFTADTHVTRLAYEQFPKEAKFLAGFTAMTLNEEAYKDLRSVVATKVASRFAGSVAALELDPA